MYKASIYILVNGNI